jgi:8-oxo-dGTP diphosphatase
MALQLRRKVLETVLCFVRDDQDRFLFLYRGKKAGDVHQGKYNAPGGKIEPGESPLEAVFREVLEETGLRVTYCRRLGFLAFPGFHEDAEGGAVDESVHVFLVTGFEGDMLTECDEGVLEWVPAARVMELPLWEGDRHFLPFVIDERRFEGKLVYEKGKLVSWKIEAELPPQ